MIQDKAEELKSFKEGRELIFNFIDNMTPNGLPVKNMTCIQRHCKSQIEACIGNSLCQQDLGCAATCWEDSLCTYTCSQSYDNQYYDDMMKCLLVDYECLSLPPPDEYNDATCRDPSDSALTIDDVTMTGSWYVLQGYNPTYDCWDCAKQTFDTIGDEVDYAAFFNMLAANGTEMWVSSAYTGTKSSDNTVYLATTDFGMPDE